MIDRRKVVAGGLASILGHCCCACRASAQASNRNNAVEGEPLPDLLSCILMAAPPTASEDENSPESLARASFLNAAPGTGNRALDYALAQTLSRITDVFQVLPGFVFYDDREHANAFATPRLRFRHTDGSVLFGRSFLKQLLSTNTDGEIALTAVCAHEFAHILQFKRGLVSAPINSPGAFGRLELQADLLAGYFAGTRKRARRSYPAAVFTETLASLNVSNDGQRSHGTPSQRRAVIARGFNAAYRERRNLEEAVALAMRYVDHVAN